MPDYTDLARLTARFGADMLIRATDRGPVSLGVIDAAVVDKACADAAGGAWTPWSRDYHAGNLLGPVSQSAGIPTGRVIERGSNANGDFVRFADGTQMCWSGSLTFANANTVDGSIFRSATVLWTYPAAMVSAATTVVNGSVDDVDCWLSTGPAALTACNVRIKSSITKATAINARALAIGRWF